MIQKLLDHIDRILAKGDAILIHSVHGMNRSVALTAAYLMYKFAWNAQKAIEFLTMKKSTIKLRRGFFNQLTKFENILEKKGKSLSSNWKSQPIAGFKFINEEEELLTNTYINTTMLTSGKSSGQRPPISRIAGEKGVKWAVQVRKMIPNKRINFKRILGKIKKNSLKIRKAEADKEEMIQNSSLPINQPVRAQTFTSGLFNSNKKENSEQRLILTGKINFDIK